MTKMSSYEREMEQGDRFRNEKGWGEQKTENRDRTYGDDKHTSTEEV